MDLVDSIASELSESPFLMALALTIIATLLDNALVVALNFFMILSSPNYLYCVSLCLKFCFTILSTRTHNHLVIKNNKFTGGHIT